MAKNLMKVQSTMPQRSDGGFEVAFHEKDDRHPGGELFVGDDNVYEVYPTPQVMKALSDGRIKELDDAEAKKVVANKAKRSGLQAKVNMTNRASLMAKQAAQATANAEAAQKELDDFDANSKAGSDDTADEGDGEDEGNSKLLTEEQQVAANLAASRGK